MIDMFSNASSFKVELDEVSYLDNMPGRADK